MRNPAAILIVVAAALLLMLGSVFVVNESQTAIVLNLGKIVRSNLQPGLHFKWPLIQNVRRSSQYLADIACRARLLASSVEPTKPITVRGRMTYHIG